MKNITLSLLLCLLTSVTWAQKSLMLQHRDGCRDYALVSAIDEISFSEDLSQFTIVSGSRSVTIDRSDVVTMEYVTAPEVFCVTYGDNMTIVHNPYLLQGVTACVTGGDVSVCNENVDEELTFSLTGETASGSFLYNGNYKSTIILDGVTIANPKGPAIDLQCGKRVALELKKGTVNNLSDGFGGDWKAALYCKGHLEVDKAGTLNVTGNSKHAICAKEYIQLKKSSGIINVQGAKGDGIHCQQYFLANGYEVNIKSVDGDGIQAEFCDSETYAEDCPNGSLWIQGGSFDISCSSSDAAGLKADSDITLNEEKGTLVCRVSMSGAGSKGMKADGNVTILAGSIDISNSGAVLTEGSDSQTAKCISADKSVHLAAGDIQLATTGVGGKCVKCDEGFTMGIPQTGTGPMLKASATGGTSANKVADSADKMRAGGFRPGGGGGPGGGGPGGGTSSGSSAKAIKAKGAISIYGGESTIATLSDGAEGMESKTSIDIAGGRHYIKTYDDAINSSGPIAFDGGVTVCYSTGNDAVDSNYGRAGAIVIGDGKVLAYTTRGGAEMGFDCDGNSNIKITGHGIAISAGGNQGGSSSSTLSNAAQGYVFLTSSINYKSGCYYTLSDSQGKAIVTYSFEGDVNSSCSLITATGMTKGSAYSVTYGTLAPTDTVESFHGLYIGGTSQKANNVATFTAK